MARPYWSGQISISLVNFAVELYPAASTSRPFQFHQIDRATGQRIHHQNVAADSDQEGDDRHSVEKADVVKGYEYEKGKYAIIEPEDLKRLRIPGTNMLEIAQFTDSAALPASLYEKPYFVVPKKGPQATAFAVVRQAMIDTGTVGLGEIAISGREHLVALAPPPDPKQPGMMLYVLRFAAELRDPGEYYGKMAAPKLVASQLDLAKQLIKTYKRPLDLEQFQDHYEAAVKELVEAKLANKPLAKETPSRAKGKVVDLMSALRQSLGAKDGAKTAKSQAKSSSTGAKRKLKLVSNRRRKTA